MKNIWQKNKNYGSESFLLESQKLLESETHIFLSIFRKIRNSSNDIDVGVGTLIIAFIDSSRSLLLLAKNQKLRDSYLCARTIIEIILNIGFFSAKGKPAIDKAMNYAKQKSYRDLNRKLHIGEIFVGIGLNDFDKIPVDEELKKCIEEFTSTKGKEIRSWTNESTTDKIAIISEKYGKDLGTVLSFSLFIIYRYASEIAHASLFGEFFVLGRTLLENERPKTNLEVQKFQLTCLTEIILCIYLAAQSIIPVLNKHYDVQDELNKSKKNLSAFKRNYLLKK
ncbi:MAG TPA: DUF5677 domain-containing protein [Ignavibacteriaceae bacterium]|nr:DUF5677 domain-containing protein [Ignavibacteriaceae bacterium]